MPSFLDNLSYPAGVLPGNGTWVSRYPALSPVPDAVVGANGAGSDTSDGGAAWSRVMIDGTSVDITKAFIYGCKTHAQADQIDIDPVQLHFGDPGQTDPLLGSGGLTIEFGSQTVDMATVVITLDDHSGHHYGPFTVAAPHNQTNTFEVRFDGTNTSVWVNGVSIYSTAVFDFSALTPHGLYVNFAPFSFSTDSISTRISQVFATWTQTNAQQNKSALYELTGLYDSRR